jgi:hypothetical protein
MQQNTELKSLNFVLTGLPRSGAFPIAQAINKCRKAICHSGVLDPDEQERTQAHVDYFGTCPHTLPWGEMQPSLERYLVETIMEKPQNFESACGVFLTNKLIDEHNLYHLLSSWSQSSDFAFIHVVRNPVESCVSFMQAQQTERHVGAKAWALRRGMSAHKPRGVHIELEELTRYVDWSIQAEAKIKASLHYQTIRISHRRIVTDWWNVISDVFYFLELPQSEAPPAPIQRYPHYELSRRCSNWDDLKKRARYDIAALMKAAEQEEV